MLPNYFVAFILTVLSCFWMLNLVISTLPPEEVDALQQIASTMGAKYWEFDADSCDVKLVGVTAQPPSRANASVGCQCGYQNDTFCHVVSVVLKGYNLPGTLPDGLGKLPYLKEIDFAYNYLNGTIPKAWSSLQLAKISLLVNRLSGVIPEGLGNITSLTYLTLDANRISGPIPSALGKLINLETLILSSNRFAGNLPTSFAGFSKLKDLRINDNNFSGTIPKFIENLKQLQRLEMHASGLEGPIPSEISTLTKLTELRISDLSGPYQLFPDLSNMGGLVILVLRSCRLSGPIPKYIWSLGALKILDLSFNRLVGEIPASISVSSLKICFLSGNLLTGDIPESILKVGTSVDLSYNNFTQPSSKQAACRDSLNLNLNLFRSSFAENSSTFAPPCLDDFSCPSYSSNLHINCGGKDAKVEENKRAILYRGDVDVTGGSAKYFLDRNAYWGFSSTGDFMDDDDLTNVRYTVSLSASNLDDLYASARTAPTSLAYFHYCLENGNYTMNLHFAEIQFTNDSSSSSLGERLFDIYVQDKLVWTDFNIEDEAGGARTKVIKVFNVSITNHRIEVRFYWAGKGTTRIPQRGVYGPLVSAISIVSDSKVHSSHGKERTAYIAGGIAAFCTIILTLLCAICWKRWRQRNRKRKEEMGGMNLQTRTFTLKQIKAATDDFDPSCKIGEGGFGPVYKGELADGTMIAVKQLSSRSRQGNREFMNEIGMISCLHHPNLVKLHGFCIEGEQLLLVYEYMENNSLARALFGSGNNRLQLDWPTRFKICIGIAKGLAFLHEESRLRIVHRDIKATNVLLDRDLNPKISDFGLARLDEVEKTHVSTKLAGTIGYMAPEYVLRGRLSYKADVYSYGIVVLEIVSGKNNTSRVADDDSLCLLDLLQQACHLQKSSSLMELVDDKLKPDINKDEVETVVKVALLCINTSPSLRPVMSDVVRMLEGSIDVPESSTNREDAREVPSGNLAHVSSRNQTSEMSTTGTSSSWSQYGCSEIELK